MARNERSERGERTNGPAGKEGGGGGGEKSVFAFALHTWRGKENGGDDGREEEERRKGERREEEEDAHLQSGLEGGGGDPSSSNPSRASHGQLEKEELPSKDPHPPVDVAERGRGEYPGEREGGKSIRFVRSSASYY